MNESKRKFMNAIPLAAMGFAAVAGSMRIAEHEVKAVEVKPNKRYAFVVPDDCTQEEMQQMKAILTARGFSDVLLVSGPLEIYELDK